MKTLLLMRHAKSDWSDGGLDDFDRPLNRRGRSDLPRLTRLLEAYGPTPAAVLASPALRARQTAEGLSQGLGLPAPSFDEGLYLAPADRILHRAARTDPALEALLLVAHNPGMEEAVRALCGARLHMPTGGVAAVDLGAWTDAAGGRGVLRYFVVPRLLKAHGEAEARDP